MMRNKYLLLIVIGLAIRLLVMPFTLHHDFWAISISQYLFVNHGVINIYHYLASLPVDNILVKNYGANFYTYPPLTYFTIGIFGYILKPLYNQGFLNHMIYNLGHILEDRNLYFHLVFVKFPYLIFDFGTAFFISRLFNDKRRQLLSFAFWLFNPLAIYVSYMMGQFDIIPVFWTVFALYLIKKNKYGFACLSLGIGGAYKMFPLFFLPFVLFYKNKSPIKAILYTLIGLSPFIVSILPFIKTAAFRTYVLASEQTQKIFIAKIPVSAAESLSLFVIGYVVIFCLSISFYRGLWRWWMAALLLMFGVSHFHPQWFIWLTPFLIIFLIKNRQYRFLVVGLLVCWFLIFILFEPALLILIFAPLNHSLVNTINLPDLIGRYYDIYQFKNLIRSTFAGLSLFLIFTSLIKEDENS